MFKTKHIPIYVDDVSPAIGKDNEGEERNEIELKFRIHPISPELAAELDDAVRSVLFEQKGDNLRRLKSVTFDLTVMPQFIELRSAPDTKTAWLQVPIATIEKISATRHKGIAGWALSFHAKFDTPGGSELARIHRGYKKQHFATFDQAAKDLIDEMRGPEETAKASRPAKPTLDGASDVKH